MAVNPLTGSAVAVGSGRSPRALPGVGAPEDGPGALPAARRTLQQVPSVISDEAGAAVPLSGQGVRRVGQLPVTDPTRVVLLLKL